MEYRKGERIRTESDLHASGEPVIPAGTEGRIAGERYDLFESYVQVDFDNGAHAEIPRGDIESPKSFHRPEAGW